MENPFLPDSTPRVFSELQEAIRKRAEEIYLESGRIPGRDLENWSRAEQEILRQVAGNSAPRKAVVVRVKGVQYVGEYQPESCNGYVPGEFGTGASVPVRFEGEKMFVQRPSGRELETTIVQKIG